MSDPVDDRILQFLREAAPPARDPVFRLKVLERREQRRFQQRLFTMLVGALLIVLASAFAVGIGRGALKTTGAMIVGAALASACAAFQGRLPRILRRFSF